MNDSVIMCDKITESYNEETKAVRKILMKKSSL